jgi:hypothetical protein
MEKKMIEFKEIQEQRGVEFKIKDDSNFYMIYVFDNITYGVVCIKGEKKGEQTIIPFDAIVIVKPQYATIREAAKWTEPSQGTINDLYNEGSITRLWRRGGRGKRTKIKMVNIAELEEYWSGVREVEE